MPSTEQTKEVGGERLQRIISLCKSIEERGLDPFIVEVDDLIEVVRKYFPAWERPEELCLDAEAIHHLASVIKLQSDWVKHRSSSLYTDPFLLEEKVRRLDKEELVNLFLRVWHPIVELEQITLHSLAQSLRYWEELAPISQRWQKPSPPEREIGSTTREDLIKQRILTDEVFSSKLENFWEELKQEVGDEQKIRYWDFVGADTYSNTIRRAYLTSFLVTYGYATLEVYKLSDQIFIKALEEPSTLEREEQLVSVPVSVSFKEWNEWKEGRQA
ncbi:hypothetical protein GWN63_01890 [Candidatus Bathyarchaeota archaeon]|nr:hypothetical protein [Candidatus Bathyarchaeota archaeon]NIU80986.1 hypothetical protein [Candidatus Bathyarchaeota archaeon]NIV67631.1 hypothetical protein [Candidatus Bathyarchaeota archaeon]NIW16166.1 hypothetical protein [Candidatus Bathyarchaeota archaeon]NIW34252.1 hypothetical protein [Candidatus Bathyarchaeota archaeon]